MKYAILTLLLFMIGCTYDSKFKYGDEVVIAYGFYRGCEASLTEFDGSMYLAHMKSDCGYSNQWVRHDQIGKISK